MMCCDNFGIFKKEQNLVCQPIMPMQDNQNRVIFLNFFLKFTNEFVRKIENILFVYRRKDPEFNIQVCAFVIFIYIAVKPPYFYFIIRIVVLNIFTHVAPEPIRVKPFFGVRFFRSMLRLIIMTN